MKEIEKAAIEEANELVTAGKADIAEEEYTKLQVAFLDGVKFGKEMAIDAFIHKTWFKETPKSLASGRN